MMVAILPEKMEMRMNWRMKELKELDKNLMCKIFGKAPKDEAQFLFDALRKIDAASSPPRKQEN